MRGSMMILRKKLKAFYYFRLRRKSLRKLFKYRAIYKRRNYTTFNSENRFLTPSVLRSDIGATVESRFDVYYIA